MPDNLYQVLSSTDVDEILEEHVESLVVIMFSSKSCSPCRQVKPTFVQSSKDNPNCYFLYIDIGNFEDKNLTYLNNVKGTPKFSYFFNNQEIAYILGGDKEVYNNTLHDLKNRIEAKKREILLYESENKQKEEMKRNMLNNLFEIQKAGVRLSKTYNMNSDYNEMKWEYEFHQRMMNQQNDENSAQHTNVDNHITEQHQQNQQQIQSNQQNFLQNQQQTQKNQQEQNNNNYNDNNYSQSQYPQINQNDTESQKQEKLKKIKELNNLNHVMQMQQMMKIQQLRKLQQMKEQNENSNNNSQ